MPAQMGDVDRAGDAPYRGERESQRRVGYETWVEASGKDSFLRFLAVPESTGEGRKASDMSCSLGSLDV